MDKIFRSPMRRLLVMVGLWITFWAIIQPSYAWECSKIEGKIIQSFVTEEAVDLSEEQITTEELKEIASDLVYGGKLPWYADWYGCSYDGETGYVVEFFPKCLDENEYDRTIYEEKVAQILDETVHDGMCPWQIALSIHDYLVANFAYDETQTHYTGYDLLVDGKAVCSGYAEAYMDLMNRAGVACKMVLSDHMTHGWNLIELEGNWYHVDVTWDDPIPDIPGNVCHDFFLKTDEEFASDQGKHYDWESDVRCTDELYQDPFWNGITSQIRYLDADTYVIDGVEYEGESSPKSQQKGIDTPLHQLLSILLGWFGLDSDQILHSKKPPSGISRRRFAI